MGTLFLTHYSRFLAFHFYVLMIYFIYLPARRVYFTLTLNREMQVRLLPGDSSEASVAQWKSAVLIRHFRKVFLFIFLRERGRSSVKSVFIKYLFEKHIFAGSDEKQDENVLEILFALAGLFNIRIVSGQEHARKWMINLASELLGEEVPQPFYLGFPESVRALSRDELLFDQLVHYSITYGFGHFSEAGHSLLEETFERTAFKENAEIKDFSILTEKEAEEKLAEYVENLLSGTRPLSDEQYDLLKEYIKEYHYTVKNCASKNTAVRLLLDFRNVEYARFLSMSDVIKVVDEMNYRFYKNENLKKLNLKNQDRRLLNDLINVLFDAGHCDIRVCYEKKKLWKGLLHHIHYKPQSETARYFTEAMRGKGNRSVFSAFEKAMSEENIRKAAGILKDEKGSGAFLRNMNYIVSRCKNEEEIRFAVDCIDTKNVIVLLQLLLQYKNIRSTNFTGKNPRTFRFTKYNKLKIHEETKSEWSGRRSGISEATADILGNAIMENLEKVLAGRLGKVYIHPDMKNYALPLQENTAEGGFGVLPKGSRLHIEDTRKIRAFTYWEKVNDIDLSVFGLDENGRSSEFSWRTMASRQSKAITFSGDQTSGYNGGSEYFDIDLDKFMAERPQIRYLIFCDNVFSGIPFAKCFCKAGYMTRDILDSGQVFEPKTVQSSFMINCEGTFAYLFGVDLKTRDFVWLNTARSSNSIIAGSEYMAYMLDYFHVTEVMNYDRFFRMMASEVVENPDEAEVIVTDETVSAPENVEVIREYDFEKVIALMNL